MSRLWLWSGFFPADMSDYPLARSLGSGLFSSVLLWCPKALAWQWLRAACLSPVLSPGWWLPGPGVERSQENPRRDPGQGQHRGKCVGTLLALHSQGSLLLFPTSRSPWKPLVGISVAPFKEAEVPLLAFTSYVPEQAKSLCP